MSLLCSECYGSRAHPSTENGAAGKAGNSWLLTKFVQDSSTEGFTPLPSLILASQTVNSQFALRVEKMFKHTNARNLLSL